MKIVHIVRDISTSEVTIRGYIYRRTREMNGVSDRKLKEVCWIPYVDDDDPREPLIQRVETRVVSEVVIRRRNIRSLDMAFPALSFRDTWEKQTRRSPIAMALCAETRAVAKVIGRRHTYIRSTDILPTLSFRESGRNRRDGHQSPCPHHAHGSQTQRSSILHVDDDDPREPLIQGVETGAASEVFRRRNT